jgi:hypothetical protein
MDRPNNASCLRRQNSLPAKLKRRSSMLRTRLPGMKSNPYVGSFRHSPPTSVRSIDLADVDVQQNYDYSALNIGGLRPVPMKSSPYVGWFRHSPPSNIHFHKVDRQHRLLLERCHQLAMILETLPPCNNSSNKTGSPKLSEIINGRLLGGGKEGQYPHKTSSLDHTHLLSSIKSALEESSTESSSATIKILARLGSWFLFPLAYDAESCGYKHHHVCDNDKILSLFPPKNTNNNTTRNDDDSDYDDSDEDNSTDDSDEDDDDDTDGSCSVLSDYDRCIPTQVPTTPPQLLAAKHSQPLDISVSDIAQAYYTHQITEELGFVDDGNQRLDYVITQMDIARMARNASRHLDVDSILNLPTVTYHDAVKKNNNQRAPSGPTLEEESRDEAWSWMMVQEGTKSTDRPSSSDHDSSNSTSSTSRQAEEDQADVCVICLEHFMDGDRLRVLPCDHSFHVGCIDRWLSGSHSHEACFTSGCPTCKKRPNYLESSSSDGSVPSWAFARLGDALANQASSSSTP